MDIRFSMGIYADEDEEKYSLVAGIWDGDGEKLGSEEESSVHLVPH